MFMARSMKIPDEEMELLRREARLASRSIAGQVTHWLRIGRSIERAPDFNYAHIREALQALSQWAGQGFRTARRALRPGQTAAGRRVS